MGILPVVTLVSAHIKSFIHDRVLDNLSILYLTVYGCSEILFSLHLFNISSSVSVCYNFGMIQRSFPEKSTFNEEVGGVFLGQGYTDRTHVCLWKHWLLHGSNVMLQL